MNQLSDPIAVFDSGMGGISVLREMTKLMPNEDFIYYGDSKHAPYGTKTLEEVRTLTIEHITYLIKEKHAKAIAVACNTATSAAVRILRDMYPDLPLVGVEPAIKPAVLTCEHAKVIVIGYSRHYAKKNSTNWKVFTINRRIFIPSPVPV